MIVRDAYGLFFRRDGDVIERAYPLKADASKPAAFVPVVDLSAFVVRNDTDAARLALWLGLPA